MHDSIRTGAQLQATTAAAAVAAGPLITGLARAVSPFKDGCPNNPPCEHTGYVHEPAGDDDPLPTCRAYNEVGPCPCGDAPAGFRRLAGQRVWQPGQTVPAGTWVMTNGGIALGGVAWNQGSDWGNHFPAPLIEIEPEWDGGPPSTASPHPGDQPAGQPGPAGRYTLRFDHIGRHYHVPPLVDLDATDTDHLARLVQRYATTFLYSGEVSAWVDLEESTGAVLVDGIRHVGSFTIEPTGLPASGQPEEAAGGQEP